MLRPRVIPCLLVHKGGIVKTVRFADPRYVGDPLNAVRIFNEKQVDELIVLDIDASVDTREPDYQLIAHLASECRMPLCYGGGVKRVDQVERIIELGVEKVALSSAALETPDIVSQMAAAAGSQSIVAVLDVRGTGTRAEIWTHNGTRRTGQALVPWARRMQGAGAGEIVVNAIDRDGTMTGYDLDLMASVRAAVTLPLTALGGAGSLDDIRRLIGTFGIIGAAAGSLFVFKGPYRAVLINYPKPAAKDAIVLNPA
ncbi:MAG: AglZ/HisF2 family acetamidino modification protein [Vicinamibacterales bacterium]